MVPSTSHQHSDHTCSPQRLRIPIVLGTVSPELRQANTEIAVELSLVPVDDILNLITLCVVAYNQTLVIRRALVHHLTEELKGGRQTRSSHRYAFCYSDTAHVR